MALREIKLDYDGAMPVVEIAFERSCLGRYLIELGRNGFDDIETVMTGSIDGCGTAREAINLHSTSTLTTADLRERILGWHLLVAPRDGETEQPFSARIRILQDGRPVEGGLLEFSGAVLRPENVVGVARFV
jgi:hypothetical protein